jgi:large subunit ribosomal protein L13
MMKTYSAKPKEIERKWHLIDAKDLPLGRLASQVASILRGKHKAIFTPHIDTGDFVIVINAEKIKLTGNKIHNKMKYRHSGYPGGLKETPIAKQLAEKPEDVIWDAVWGMIPHNRLGRDVIKKMKVYRGPEHPHKAQNPEKKELAI